MLNELYEKLEAVLNRLDVGGEQSRAFEGEIVLLRELLSYRPVKTAAGQFQITLQEQSPCFEPRTIMLRLLAENGQLWIQPQGYGEKCTEDGEGSPVGIEIWEDRLRLVVFDDINSEDPRIIDLENAKETARRRCNWCKTEIQADSIQWKGLLFCSESCLDACRAAQ